MTRNAREIAELSGMTLRSSADGEPEVVNDVFPESRRRRIWGGRWIHHQLPALPTADELTTLLTDHDAPPDVVAEIRAASIPVDDITAAELTIDPDPDGTAHRQFDSDQHEHLQARAEHAPEVLAHYARTFTTHLPSLRGRSRP